MRETFDFEAMADGRHSASGEAKLVWVAAVEPKDGKGIGASGEAKLVWVAAVEPKDGGTIGGTHR